jgi:sugar-phosphatase
MARFAGAVFDLDGLLIDSERVWERVQVQVFADLGLELTLEMQRATTGMRMKETLEVWRGFFPRAGLDAVDLGNRMFGLVAERLRNAGVAKPGALRVVELCRKAGCRLAIASSSPPEVIGAALEGLGLATRFDAVVSAASLSDGKPHPAVYLAAAAELGVDPGNCIAFEDSVAGVRSAKGAGMYTVAVPEEHNRGRAEYGIADLELGSLEEFPERLLVDPG